MDVWRMIAESETTVGIAQKLSVSPKTIEFHRARLMRRLNIFDVAGLTREAARRGIITLCCDT